MARRTPFPTPEFQYLTSSSDRYGSQGDFCLEPIVESPKLRCFSYWCPTKVCNKIIVMVVLQKLCLELRPPNINVDK